MIPFYCIDGPEKNKTILSNFKPTYNSDGSVYQKSTYAIKIPQGILYADIAHVEALEAIEITEDIPFHIRPKEKATIEKHDYRKKIE